MRNCSTNVRMLHGRVRPCPPYSLSRRPWQLLARAPAKQSEIDDVIASVGQVHTRYAGLFDAITCRSGFEVALEDGRRSIEFVTAVYHSSRTGQQVRFLFSPDQPLYGGWLS